MLVCGIIIGVCILVVIVCIIVGKIKYPKGYKAHTESLSPEKAAKEHEKVKTANNVIWGWVIPILVLLCFCVGGFFLFDSCSTKPSSSGHVCVNCGGKATVQYRGTWLCHSCYKKYFASVRIENFNYVCEYYFPTN